MRGLCRTGGGRRGFAGAGTRCSPPGWQRRAWGGRGSLAPLPLRVQPVLQWLPLAGRGSSSSWGVPGAAPTGLPRGLPREGEEPQEGPTGKGQDPARPGGVHKPLQCTASLNLPI